MDLVPFKASRAFVVLGVFCIQQVRLVSTKQSSKGNCFVLNFFGAWLEQLSSIHICNLISTPERPTYLTMGRIAVKPPSTVKI
jgi:hypothetical protein